MPAVLSIHGGPEAQEKSNYNYWGFYQYLLSRGIGVIATNVRGSTGYGISYQRLIHRDWGGGELKDFEYAARYLQSLDWVDSGRLGVFGGSFGGFATLSCVSRLPQYWSVAVDIFGPSNLITFSRAVPEFWKRIMKRWVGDPDEDADMLRERSPITYVDDIRAPLLVIQGANDPRVVKPESDQIVEKLRENGQTVEYMVFEDEGHGFTKTANWHKALGASARWLETYLIPRPPRRRRPRSRKRRLRSRLFHLVIRQGLGDLGVGAIQLEGLQLHRLARGMALHLAAAFLEYPLGFGILEQGLELGSGEGREDAAAAQVGNHVGHSQIFRLRLEVGEKRRRLRRSSGLRSVILTELSTSSSALMSEPSSSRSIRSMSSGR